MVTGAAAAAAGIRQAEPDRLPGTYAPESSPVPHGLKKYSWIWGVKTECPLYPASNLHCRLPSLAYFKIVYMPVFNIVAIYCTT